LYGTEREPYYGSYTTIKTLYPAKGGMIQIRVDSIDYKVATSPNTNRILTSAAVC
jgi:hypothetical protein